MTATKHTPTPWSAAISMDGRHNGFSILAPWDCDGNEPYHPLIAKTFHNHGHCDMETSRANAAYIVKAVNAHEALVEALENLVENYRSKNGDMGLLNHFIKEGDDALKLARGE